MTKVAERTAGRDVALADWLCARAFEAAPPLTGAADLAQEYLLDQSCETGDQRADHLVREETARHFTSGFLAGFGTMLQPPGNVPPAMAAAWVVAARMAGAVAGVYGHDLRAARVQTLALLSLTSDSAGLILRAASSASADADVQTMAAKLGASRLRQLRRRVVAELREVEGRRRGARDILVPGDGVDELVDATWCYAAGRTAIALFRRDNAGDRADHIPQRLTYWEAPS